MQWLRHQLSSLGQTEVEITKSILREWLPGDDRLLELAVDQPELLNCTREPKMSFGRKDLKAVVGDSGSLKTKPGKRTAFVNGSEIVMQLVPKGEFKRGKTKVKISANFWCARHEITQLQWEKITKQNPSSIQGNPYFPVDNVSYEQIAEFCQKLTASESKARRLVKGYVYRLPTENEWEYVARAGSKEDFSIAQSDFWHRGTSASRYHAVGTSKPNRWGVFDMHGNVDELVFDEYHECDRHSAPDRIRPGGRSTKRRRARCLSWWQLVFTRQSMQLSLPKRSNYGSSTVSRLSCRLGASNRNAIRAKKLLCSTSKKPKKRSIHTGSLGESLR